MLAGHPMGTPLLCHDIRAAPSSLQGWGEFGHRGKRAHRACLLTLPPNLREVMKNQSLTLRVLSSSSS